MRFLRAREATAFTERGISYLLKKLIICLLQTEQTLYKIRVGTADHALLGHVPLAFLGFLGEDVTFERLLVSDLAGAGNLEALLGTRVRFDLWHFECF